MAGTEDITLRLTGVEAKELMMGLDTLIQQMREELESDDYEHGHAWRAAAVDALQPVLARLEAARFGEPD
jgi:hypothetical protein